MAESRQWTGRSWLRRLATLPVSSKKRGFQMSLSLNVRKVKDVSVVDVSGRVRLGDGSTELRDALRNMAKQGDKQILLNLSAVTYLDSSGIGALVSSYATLRNEGGRIKLVNVTGRVKDLLLITKLYTVFEVFEDEATAVESFSGIPVDTTAVK
jgi:anti-sigma B factor antagonist